MYLNNEIFFPRAGLDTNHIFLGILYLTTTNLETYTLKGWFIISPLWKAVIHKMYDSTPKCVVTKNLPNQPVSCSLLAKIPHLQLFVQLARLYVSIFLMHTHYHAKLPTLFFLQNSSWTFSMLTLSDHQFACQFLLIGFHPTRITAVSLYERIKWFFSLQQCQGPYQGIKLSLYLLLIILSYATVSLPS